MIPYNEQEVLSFQNEVRHLYTDPPPQGAGRPFDPFDDASVVWSNRMTYDATELGYAASRSKHRAELQTALGIQVPIPPATPRGPLPAWDPDTTDPETGAPLPVAKTINGTIPPLSDPLYMRADLWSMTLPGLPSVTGGASGAAQSRMLTYLFERYPREWQDKGLRQYAANGYRQWWRSIPDARDASGQTIQQYVDDTKRIQDAGLLPWHFLRSKDYDGKNPDPTKVYPWIDALLAIDGIPGASHAWEASIFYDPLKLRADFKPNPVHRFRQAP